MIPPSWLGLDFERVKSAASYEDLEDLGVIRALGGPHRFHLSLNVLSAQAWSVEQESALASLVTRLNNLWAGMTSTELKRLSQYIDEKRQPPPLPPQVLINAPLSMPSGLHRASLEGVKLHAYQRRALLFADRPRCILALEMGLGKTLISIASTYRARHKGDIQAALVIAPRSAHESWRKHLEAWALSSDVHKIITGWSPAKRLMTYELFYKGSCEWLIVTPQTFARDQRYFMRIADHHGDKISLIIDEVHKAKGEESAIGRAVEEVSKRVKRVLALTGTPQPNNISDLFHIVDRVAPHTLGEYRDFASRFTYRQFDQWDSINGSQYVAGPLKPEQLGELREALKSVMLSISASDQDVDLKLPPREDRAPYIKLDTDQRDLMRLLRKYTAERELNTPAYIQALNGEAGPVAQYAAEGATVNQSVLSVRIDQLSISPALFSPQFDQDQPFYESPKVKYLADCAAAAIAEGLAVVVFCEYVGGLEIMKRALIKRGCENVALYRGDTPPKKRAQLESALNSGNLAALIAQTKALETGANLQGFASVVMHLNTPWSPDLLAQSTARVYRQGQRKKVYVYRPSGSRIEEAKNQALSRKLIQSRAATGLKSLGDSAILNTSTDPRIRRAQKAVCADMGFSQSAVNTLIEGELNDY